MIDAGYVRQALLIRRVEETLFDLYRDGRIRGTIHASIGQEFSAVALCSQLAEGDFVFSSHRCHGHFIALTGDYRGLLAELTGRASGVCGGVGGSQHLCAPGFYSNGVQGGIMPVSAGLAMARKLRQENSIGVVFIGDGTLGEGVVYETANLVSKWQLPLLIVLEDNGYAQSTESERTLAGDICQRFEAFGIPASTSSTSDPATLLGAAVDAVEAVRSSGRPRFLKVETYRLCPHSKGDDTRSADELARLSQADPLNRFAVDQPETFAAMKAEVDQEVQATVDALAVEGAREVSSYLGLGSEPTVESHPLQPASFHQSDRRLGGRLNDAFHTLMSEHEEILFLGEDVLSPYGGAFKISAGLSDAFPERVFSTPISEAAITGVSNGLALAGFRPVVEIMFGDFITLTFDQLVNHASKFYGMYNSQVNCPMVLRTPMGGRRGYGPTHSQTLDKHLLGISHLKVLACNLLSDPEDLYRKVFTTEQHPVVVLENKVDYGLTADSVLRELEGWDVQTTSGYPLFRIALSGAKPDITIVTYGGCLLDVAIVLRRLHAEHRVIATALVMTQISPVEGVHLSGLIDTPVVFTVEEGSVDGGIGSEIAAQLNACCDQIPRVIRIGAAAVPIPAQPDMERSVLPSEESILERILEVVASDRTQDSAIGKAAQPVSRERGIQVTVPQEVANDEFCQVVSITAKDGSLVEEGQLLFEIEFSKSVIEVLSPAHGVFTQGCSVGDEVAVGGSLGRIVPETDEGLEVASDPPVFTASTAQETSESEMDNVSHQSLSAGKRREVTHLSAGQNQLVCNFVVHVDLGTQSTGGTFSQISGKVVPTVLTEVCRLVGEYPGLHCYVDEEGAIVEHAEPNLGYAIDLGEGLRVASLGDLREVTEDQVTKAIGGAARAYKRGKRPGGSGAPTFTVSDMLSEGVDHFTPLIGLRQSAVLGLCGGNSNGMTLSLTFDHRATEGRVAARFLSELKKRCMDKLESAEE